MNKITKKIALRFSFKDVQVRFSQVNGNHEITSQKRKRKIVISYPDLSHGPLELKARVSQVK